MDLRGTRFSSPVQWCAVVDSRACVRLAGAEIVCLLSLWTQVRSAPRFVTVATTLLCDVS